MTALVEYEREPDGGWQAVRMIGDWMFLSIESRGDDVVLESPAGEVVSELPLGENYKIYGEVRP